MIAGLLRPSRRKRLCSETGTPAWCDPGGRPFVSGAQRLTGYRCESCR